MSAFTKPPAVSQSSFSLDQAYNGTVTDLWEFGTLITTSCIFVMLIHIATEFKSWVSHQSLLLTDPT